MSFQEFSKKEIKEVFEELKSRESGLSEEEAEERKKIYAKNAQGLSPYKGCYKSKI